MYSDYSDRVHIKCCVIGDFNVGKTSIVKTFFIRKSKL